MRKVLIIGSGGAGKSTLSVRLGKLLKIEVFHLDVLHWNPGWVETPKPEWRKTVEELVGRETWILDGNYSGTLDIRLAACDTVVFLDVARIVCLWRVLKRWLLYRRSRRPDMAEGCREKLDLQFMLWIWNYPKRTRPKVLELLSKNAQSKTVVRLRTQAEVERFLADVAGDAEQNI